VLEPGGKATTRGTPSARAIASAVATVGSARPFFTWFTWARSRPAPAARAASVQPRSASRRAKAFRVKGNSPSRPRPTGSSAFAAAKDPEVLDREGECVGDAFRDHETWVGDP
jgi:hypothetical protein